MTIEEYVKNNISKVCDKIFLAQDIPMETFDYGEDKKRNIVDV